jgi:hypothetical protein
MNEALEAGEFTDQDARMTKMPLTLHMAMVAATNALNDPNRDGKNSV